MPTQIKLELMGSSTNGDEMEALYLDGERIAGNRDMGIMHVKRVWDVAVDDVLSALRNHLRNGKEG